MNTLGTRNDRAFTLIELLVVIAIIAILSAILFPIFATAREKSRQSSCASNMKQIGLALIQYENDYDEYYTICSNSTHKSGWANAIYPYVQSTGVFSCPSDPYKPPNGFYQCSYFLSWIMTGYNNGNMNSPNQALMLRQLVAPALTVQLAELTKGYMKPDATDPSPTAMGWGANSTLVIGAFATGPMGGPEYTSSTSYTKNHADGRHTMGANFLAFDGHVKWLLGTQVSPGYTYGGGFSPGSSYDQLGAKPPWYEDFGGTGNAASTGNMTETTGTSHFVMTFSGV